MKQNNNKIEAGEPLLVETQDPASVEVELHPIETVKEKKKWLKKPGVKLEKSGNIADILLLPFMWVSAILLKKMRIDSFQKFPRNKKLLMKIGVFPVVDHYYEPLFNNIHLKTKLSEPRNLPAIDWNISYQQETLELFGYGEELKKFPVEKPSEDYSGFYYNNPSYQSGDAEMYYNYIRAYKPERIIEIGSGYSTLIALEAIRKNNEEMPGYSCELICIEPFENHWLEKLPVKVNRTMVENLDTNYFDQLSNGDILFIDSSHIIRPYGDVLYIYNHILPRLSRGVMVHIHDIFTPRDYLEDWLLLKNRFWNEQYLVEAFLAFNQRFKITTAMNFLTHFYPEMLEKVCPVMMEQIHAGKVREPGSLWLRRV
ncbi:MAG: hypothetical protein Kow00127_03030 [Bacteroidales bacterium]